MKIRKEVQAYEDALGFTKQNKKYKITQKPTEKIQKTQNTHKQK